MREKGLKYRVCGADDAIEGDAVTLYILRCFRLISNRFCTVVLNPSLRILTIGPPATTLQLMHDSP
jgi:hypothetical protein